MNNKILLQKSDIVGIRSLPLELMRSYWNNMRGTTRISNILSSEKPVECIFINDLLSLLSGLTVT